MRAIEAVSALLTSILAILFVLPAAHAHVYICEHYYWGGECVHWTDVDRCIDLAPRGWGNRVSSFGPDPGYKCTIFPYPNCNQDIPGSRRPWSQDYEYPGSYALGNRKDQAASYVCVYKGAQFNDAESASIAEEMKLEREGKTSNVTDGIDNENGGPVSQ